MSPDRTKCPLGHRNHHQLRATLLVFKTETFLVVSKADLLVPSSILEATIKAWGRDPIRKDDGDKITQGFTQPYLPPMHSA